jgi:hypothetical protein
MVRRSQGRRTVYPLTPAFNPLSGLQPFVCGASSVISRRKSAGTNGFSRLGATHIGHQEIDRIERERQDTRARQIHTAQRVVRKEAITIMKLSSGRPLYYFVVNFCYSGSTTLAPVTRIPPN